MGIELDGKVAIVTGGARGIGKGMATALLKAGASVTITDIRQETLDQTSADFDMLPGAKHLAVTADGTKDDDVNSALQQTVDAFGRIDVLINNAQTAVTGLNLEDQSVDDVMVGVDSGFLASFRYMKACFPYLKEAQGPRSTSRRRPASSATGDDRVQRRQGSQSRAHPHRSSRVGPAQHHRQLHHPGDADRGLEGVLRREPGALQALARQHPARSPGRPGEGCRLTVVFLASEGAHYLTGETFDIDGGRCLRP